MEEEVRRVVVWESDGMGVFGHVARMVRQFADFTGIKPDVPARSLRSGRITEVVKNGAGGALVSGQSRCGFVRIMTTISRVLLATGFSGAVFFYGVDLLADMERTIFPHTEEELARYVVSQQQRREMNMEPVVRTLGKPRHLCNKSVYEEFLRRCSTGIWRTTMLNEQLGFYPERGLIRIGSGGPRCVVTYGSFDMIGATTYAHHIDRMAKSLEENNFDGNLYYRKGGYPQPEGWELDYADVPYAFKVWMLKEAHSLGFPSCMWLDSVLTAKGSIDPLFEIIEQKGALFVRAFGLTKDPKAFAEQMDMIIFPESLSALQECVGVPVKTHITGCVFGLRMDSGYTTVFQEIYDKLVKMRLPFYSRFPTSVCLGLYALPRRIVSAWLSICRISQDHSTFGGGAHFTITLNNKERM